MNKDQQRDILLADFERWQSRENGTDPTSRAGIAHATEDQAYMRGIGLIPHRGKYAQTRPYPRTDSVASDCVSIMPDGTRRIFKPKMNTRNIAGITRRVSTKDHTTQYENLLRTVGAVGNID